jgi:hypothetical protein
LENGATAAGPVDPSLSHNPTVPQWASATLWTVAPLTIA